jgi:hypothetical protein
MKMLDIHTMKTLNFELFDFPSIFGVVKSTEGLKRHQTRPLRSEVQEIAISKYSGGQLVYIGDERSGQDFFGLYSGFYYESKSIDGLFLKRAPYTKEITLKNFQGKNLGLPQKTFDYMLLWDTKSYSMGICSWEACMKNVEVKDAVISCRIHYNDIDFIVQNVIPKDKGDISSKLYQLIMEML